MTRTATLCLGTGTVGILAWSGPLRLVPLALAIPALWVAAGSRWQAGMVVLAYQLAATHDAPAAIARYYRSLLLTGAALWMLAALLVAATWAACWSLPRWSRLIGVPAALILTAIPPVGIVGWVHPITGAGVLFPGWGWLGLIAAVLATLTLAVLPRPALPLGVLVLAVAAGSAPAGTLPLSGWQGVDTHFAGDAGRSDCWRDYDRQLALLRIARASTASVLVLPESAGGLWTEFAAQLWQQGLAATGRTVVLGAELADAGGQSANVLVAVSAEGSSVVYRQRMPVPLAMWRPWSSGGTRAYWFANPTVDVRGRRSAVLICHEQLLVWPVLHSLAGRPDIVIACANAWWCGDTAIPAIQRNSVNAWARLFGRPCVTATNL